MAPKKAVAAIAVFIIGITASHSKHASQAPADARTWAATWTAAAHGPYPSGNPSAQPDLKFAFPSAEDGAVDQSFRLIVRPDLWGNRFRIRLSNARRGR
jgi:hypothetical protein